VRHARLDIVLLEIPLLDADLAFTAYLFIAAEGFYVDTERLSGLVEK